MALNVPSPANAASSVANSATLSWNDTGTNAGYDVYFGTNLSEVTNKSVNVYRGIVTTPAYDPRITLTYGATYYWLIVGTTDAAESGVLSFTVITEAAALPDAANYSKKFCAAADNQFWYENDDSPPKMVALAGLTLDTSKPVSMFELDQKVYIANDTILKVVDFVNTKLTVSAMTTPPRRGYTVTQLTSGATMIVDFVAKGTDTVIYGRTTSGTFVTTAEYTLSGDTLDPSTLVPSAVAQASTTPLHYDWEVYKDVTGDDEFGTMPTRATIGSMYRGRACLSGNSPDPHQWYQSRQNNPYDWAYAQDDAQSAVAGTDADAGKVGAIVTAQIAYSDDYLIYGSIGSLWLLRGDAAAGGSLDNLSNEIGVVDKDAWTWDDAGNLYILDLKGLYKITAGLSGIVPLTSDRIPNFAVDLALNPKTQRIVLSFDPNKQGIQISVTEIETGLNSNYWYDLQSEGFFPETYPEECAVMCSWFYNADDPNKRKALIGCYDGHIRLMDNNAKSDDTGSLAVPASEAIDSYALLGPIMIGADHGRNTLVKTMLVVTAGGNVDGTIPDSNNVAYELYVSDDAESLIEDVDSGNYALSGTIKAPGKAPLVRVRAKGVFLAVKLGNSTADQTWGLERVLVETVPKGRAR